MSAVSPCTLPHVLFVRLMLPGKQMLLGPRGLMSMLLMDYMSLLGCRCFKFGLCFNTCSSIDKDTARLRVQ